MKSEKIDLFKLLKAEYKAVEKPIIVHTSPAMYLSVDGQGAPGNVDFESAINALYSMAYTVKMGRKADGKGDYTIGKLEGIYWTDDGTTLDPSKMEKWCWRLMIRTPQIVDGHPVCDDDLEAARHRLKERKKGLGSDCIGFSFLKAGKHVQMLHVGSYDTEHETLTGMISFCEHQNLVPFGRHHEVYLSDPRRVKPENLKTILRISVK